MGRERIGGGSGKERGMGKEKFHGMYLPARHFPLLFSGYQCTLSGKNHATCEAYFKYFLQK